MTRPGRRALAPDEARVWRAVIRDVRPLPGREAAEAEAPPANDTAPERASPLAAPAPLPRPRVALPQGDLAHGAAPGLDRRSAERLKRGEMEIDGRLDLHGMTRDGAHAALVGFVARAHQAGRRCLLVITGKGRTGGGVLRSEVPRWLNGADLRPMVLGFSYARPKDGGDGALYVLVRRRRER